MVNQKDLIAATDLARELRLLNETGRPVPNYPAIWRMMVSDLIPAEQIGRRWYIRRSDVTEIAARLDLLEHTAA